MKKITMIIVINLLSVLVCYANAPIKKTNLLRKKTMELVTTESLHHEVLRKRADEVKFPLDLKTQQFIHEFQEFFTNLKSPIGKPAGLAGPQVGVSQRIIIIQVPEEAKKVRKDVYDILPPTVFINPSYTPVEHDGKNKDWEGCFSVPHKMGEVYRYTTIHYEAFTPEGKKITGTAKGFLARLLQHEVGHLNGQLYIDLICNDCRFGSLDEMMVIRKKEMGIQ